METIEQVNEDFNVKKPKKKGLLIGGIIAVALVIAVILIYFLVLTKPEFIFSKAIDKIFKVESEQYNSIKFDSKIKVSVEAEDESLQEQLAEIEKCTLKLGAQMDISEKKEIVDLGLEYDNEEVIDAQVYYNDGDMYAYFEGLFDKYIEIDMDEETQEQMNQIFESAISEEELEKSANAIKIFKDEFKTQINEYGKFEKKKDKIDIGKEEEKVTKWTLTLTEKQLYNVLSKTFSNLAKNDEFIDCFEEDDIEDILKEAAESIKNTDADSKDNLKISIYTKGLLNKLVAVDGAIFSDLEEMTITASVVKEDNGVYEYKIYQKMSREKIDLLNGKVEIEKDKDSKEEQSGKIKITGNVYELGSAELEIDYSIKYNQGIDKINVKNSVNIDDLTEEEVNGIMEKLMERPLIGDALTSWNDGLYEDAKKAVEETEKAMITEAITLAKAEIFAEYYSNQITVNQITEQKVKESVESYLGTAKDYNVEVTKTKDKLEFTITVNGIENKMNLEDFFNVGQGDAEDTTQKEETQTTTMQNEVRSEDYKYSVTYSVPNGFEFESGFSSDNVKYYYSNNNDCNAYVSIEEKTDLEIIEYVKTEYEFIKGFEGMNDGYKNFSLSQINTLKIADKEFKYQTIEYETNDYKREEVYVWYSLGDRHLFTAKLDITDKDITEEIIKGFLNISVKEI